MANADCTKNVQRKNSIHKNLVEFFMEESILERTQNCDEYFDKHVLALADLHGKQKQFPEESDSPSIAFSHIVHHEIGIFEMFMASMYRPQNSHCIYIDRKASKLIHSAVQAIVNCYNERFSDSKGKLYVYDWTDPIYWGHISLLEADLRCLRSLLENNNRWEYYVNTAGSELPLVTYPEFVNKLQEAGGSIIDSFKLTNHFRLVDAIYLER